MNNKPQHTHNANFLDKVSQYSDTSQVTNASIEHFTRTYQDKIDNDKALTRPERTVLKAICYYAESKGVCYFNQKTGIVKSGYSRAQFIRILDNLIEKRFVWSIHTSKPNGRRATNTYLINWPAIGIHKFNNISIVTLFNLRYDHKLCQHQLDNAFNEYHQQLKPEQPVKKPKQPEKDSMSHFGGDLTGLYNDLKEINVISEAKASKQDDFFFKTQKIAERFYENSSKHSKLKPHVQENYRQYQTNQYRIAIKALLKKTSLPEAEVIKVLEYTLGNEFWCRWIYNAERLLKKFFTIHRQMYGNYCRVHIYNEGILRAKELQFQRHLEELPPQEDRWEAAQERQSFIEQCHQAAGIPEGTSLWKIK